MTPRADAQRNYEHLLAAAKTAFNATGADASLDDIAREAGVGNATLYRHFPTREKLLEAVYDEQIQAFCATGRALLDSPPAQALRQWQLAAIAHFTQNRGLADAILAEHRGTAPPRFAEWHHLIEEVAASLLERAQQAGVVRTDLTAHELTRLTSAIATIAGPDAVKAKRLLSLLMEGLEDSRR
jgi:AcrR family transcriptional regulator